MEKEKRNPFVVFGTMSGLFTVGLILLINFWKIIFPFTAAVIVALFIFHKTSKNGN